MGGAGLACLLVRSDGLLAWSRRALPWRLAWLRFLLSWLWMWFCAKSDACLLLRAWCSTWDKIWVDFHAVLVPA